MPSVVNSVTIGKQFGLWTVIGKPYLAANKYYKVECRCRCGTIRTVSAQNLLKRYQHSCGCHVVKHGQSGYTRTSEYTTWKEMKSRCCNPNDHAFARYGGRGIKVAVEWIDSFEAFFEYMGTRPSADHSIDRIDNNGHYEPGNVRWATRKEQGRNKRNNLLVSAFGKTQTVPEWCEELGMKYSTVYMRLRRGLPPEDALGK